MVLGSKNEILILSFVKPCNILPQPPALLRSTMDVNLDREGEYGRGVKTKTSIKLYIKIPFSRFMILSRDLVTSLGF